MAVDPLFRDPARGTLSVSRLGARVASPGDPPRSASLRTAPASDAVQLPDLALSFTVESVGDGLLVRMTARNTGSATLRLDALCIGLRWTGVPTTSLRFLRHGWQSWSVTEGRALDDAGERPFPSGPWLRGMFHALGESPADRAGWHESELVSAIEVTPDGVACCAGVLERGESLGVVYLKRERDAVAIEVEMLFERPLAPGESVQGEPVRLSVGDSAYRLLEQFAAAHGRVAGARTRSRFQAGWCSWYHFFHSVTEDDLRRNLDALAAARNDIPIDVVQLDDGYQRAIGDWLETNEKFPSGLEPLARAIRDAGFRPGLWTAPFCIASDARIFSERPEWLLREGDDLFRGLHHGMWSKDGWIRVLDASRDDVLTHLERTFSSLVAMGWTYQKLDFLYTEAMQADAADPAVSRAGRLRRGLEAVRRGCGDEAFLLGCGCPLGPAIGVVDGMRIGPDVAPSWHVDVPIVLPGLSGTQPSTRNGVRNVLSRAWMHRRYWLADPDCLMTRERDTKLTPDEARTLGAVTAATGEMVIFSDDVPGLGGASLALVRDTVRLAREVDAEAGASGVLVHGLLDAGIAPVVVSPTSNGVVLSLVNGDDAPRQCRVDLARLGHPVRAEVAEQLLATTASHRIEDGVLIAELPAHASLVLRLPSAPPVAVFCDFDGTFARLDVGSTLAQRHAGGKRAGLLARVQRGELRPWEYNLEILDRLPVTEEMVNEFLETVALDPGARALVDWCAGRGFPFRILSDGFDRNLDRLQQIHALPFAYDANRLRYENDGWRIEAGHPDPACSCGTGTCKRGRIVAFRRAHPGTLAVHIGDGRVSDRCGAREADLVFAKHTLAEVLAEDGIAFEPFETLLDVVAFLERRFS